jgi:hypothetical protein
MSRKGMKRIELWPALDDLLCLSWLALVLTAAGLGWACAASLKGSPAASAASAGGSWRWFTDDAFHAPSPEEQEQLSDFGAVRQESDPQGPVVEIERPSGTRISCPFDVSIRFRPGRDPSDPSRFVPVNLHSVKVMAEKLNFPRGIRDITPGMQFSDSGFSKAGVVAPSGKYRFSIAFTDQLGRTARAQAEVSIEN